MKAIFQVKSVTLEMAYMWELMEGDEGVKDAFWIPGLPN